MRVTADGVNRAIKSALARLGGAGGTYCPATVDSEMGAAVQKFEWAQARS